MSGSVGCRVGLSALLAGVALVLPMAAAGQSAVYRTNVEGRERIANVSVERVGGVEYVYLSRLVEGLGGVFNLMPRRMTVEFGGTRAWVQVDDKRVKAFTIFTLEQPIRRVGEELLIARSDIPRFFEESFKMSVVEGGASASANPETMVPAEPRRVESTDSEMAEPLGLETLDNATAERALRSGGLRPAPAGDRPIEVVVIDPGHGGRDEGVNGRAGSKEKDIALLVSLALRDALASRSDVKVAMTREEDIYLSLKERAVLAAAANADMVLTIHVGGSPSPNARGAAIFYPPVSEEGNSRYSITNATTAGGSPASRGYRDIGSQSRDVATAVADALGQDEGMSLRGVYAAPCRLLTHVGVPGLLVEVGATTNISDEAVLVDQAALERIAGRIADGVVAYLGEGG